MFKKFGKSCVAMFCVAVLLVSMVGTALFTTAAAATITQGFEAPKVWDGNGSSITKDETIFIQGDNDYQQYIATDSGDTNVHSGSKSLYKSTFTGTKNTSLITEGMELVVGQAYNVEMWIKVIGGTGTLKFIQMSGRSNGWSSGWNNADTTTVITQVNSSYDSLNQWKKFEFSFTAGQKYFAISSESVGFYMDDVTITPVADEVTVTIEANNGEEVPPVKGAPGAALTLPTVTKDGYEFVAWHTKAELNAPFTSEVFPGEDVTLYAQWKKVGSIIQDFEAPTV